MNIFRLILNSLKHSRASNIATSLGIAITTAIICGALIIGDSINHSLFQILEFRLGKITHTITAGERIFTYNIADKINQNNNIKAASVIHTNGTATIQESGKRANNVQIWGVNNDFANFFECDTACFNISYGEAFINQKLAHELNLNIGDFILVKFRNLGAIPANTPFVAEGNLSVSRRIKISAILDQNQAANFNLQTSQITPNNLFVNIDWLNRILDLENNANIIVAELQNIQDYELLNKELHNAFSLDDLNLELKKCESTNGFIISSKRVFIDDYITSIISNSFSKSGFYLTYFANSIESDSNTTPYSFITAVDSSRFNIGTNEIVVNEWLADDLQINIGDSLKITFFELGILRELTEKESYFVVTEIISMEESMSDKNLMPFIPGLSDAGSCSDWNAGVPIDLKSIRQKDEDYWNLYKGTPKAYISIKTGQELWSNRFGSLTGITLPSNIYSENDIAKKITQNLKLNRLEFTINEVKKMGEMAATNGEDFTSLFAGLGMFIIFSGLLLTILLLNLSLKRRESQIKLYNSIGFSKKMIRKIILGEFVVVAVFGALVGVVFSVFYSKLIMLGLNHVWYDIVRTDIIILQYNYSSIIIGAFSGIVLSFFAAIIGINLKISENVVQQKIRINQSHLKKLTLKYLSVVMLISSIGMFVYLVAYQQFDDVFLWLLSGIIMFVALLGVSVNYLVNLKPASINKFSGLRLSIGNVSRNPLRSFNIILLLAIGSFVIIITYANRQDITMDYSSNYSGTGGFEYFAETKIPVLRNLNNNDTKTEFNIPKGLNFVQFFSVYDDDASCLNLNEVANPRILAVNPKAMENRFSFVSMLHNISSKNPWLALDEEINNIIPAVADQTVIRWGLGKSVGDTLYYKNSNGEKIKLLLVAGLANSIFQGNVIISERNFKIHFPELSGTNVFLIEKDNQQNNEIAEQLNFIFRDYAWEITSTKSRLAKFNSVQNTYLQIFFLLGAIGILLGTFGVSIVLAKSLIERKSEIALFSSMGFSLRKVSTIFILEYSILLFLGIAIGNISALITVFPSFYLSITSFIGSILFVNMIIIINGFFWITIITFLIIRKLSIPMALRNQ